MILRVSIFAFLVLAAAECWPAEVLDRIAVTVNGHPLLQSDVDEELHYEFFAAKRSLTEESPEERKAALDRLIDQELLHEQMRSADFKPAQSEDVSKAVDTFKTGYGPAASWTKMLAEYQITEDVITSHVENELNQLRLIDLRLRPSIQVDGDSVQTYYEHELLPKLPPGQHPSLQEATPGIREVLIQQKMNESLDAWLQALRSQARIQQFGAALGDQQK